MTIPRTPDVRIVPHGESITIHPGKDEEGEKHEAWIDKHGQFWYNAHAWSLTRSQPFPPAIGAGLIWPTELPSKKALCNISSGNWSLI